MKKVINDLKKYDTIFVTGAQRSGTNIAARIIAHIMGKKYIHENDFNVHDFDKMLTFVGDSVIQAPALSHTVCDVPKDIAVVFMLRDFDDIIKSEKRVGWIFGDGERKKYYNKYGIPLDDKRPICQIKHDVFFEHDSKLPNTYQIHYNDLQGHPLWIDKQHRKDFEAWQTEIK